MIIRRNVSVRSLILLLFIAVIIRGKRRRLSGDDSVGVSLCMPI